MRINYYSFFRFVIAAFLIIGTSNIASAQIKIGANGAIIAPSSILELESNNQGLLLPRLTDTVAINTLNPPNGMIIYLTKWPAVGLYVRKTTGWEFLTGSLGGNGTFNNLTVGGTLIAQNFSGNLIGNASTATLATTATNAVNVNITNDLSTSTVSYPTFVTNTPGSTSMRTSSTKLSFVPNTGILTAVGFKGNLVGDVTGVATSSIDAVNASNTDVEDDVVSNSIQYPTFVTATNGNLPQKTSSTNLTYIPLTGELKALKFNGPLQGNASSATQAQDAVNSQNSRITDDMVSSVVSYPVFVNSIFGNQPIKSSSSYLTYVPSTGILTAKGFVGNLTGDVTGTVSNAKDADNAAKIQVVENSISTIPFYPTFVSGTVGPLSATINSSKLKYIPATGEFFSPIFKGELIGNASTTTTATNAANVVVTDDSANSLPTYPVFVNAITGNQAIKSSSSNLSYVPSTGILTAKGFVGNLVGDVTGRVSNAQDADNAAKIQIAEDAISNVPVYPTFVTGAVGPLTATINSSKLKYIPSTGELIAPVFKGELVGNASTTTTATNAANVLITDDVSNSLPTYPVFVNAINGNQAVKSSSTNLSYVPSTGILTAKGFVGNLVGNVTGEVSNALNAVNAANINVSADDISAGTVYPVFVSATTGSLQPKVSSNFLGFKPLTGELTAPTFRGEFIGNATTATSTTTATNSVNSAITDDNSNTGTFFPVFVGTASGNQAIKSSSSNLRYVPSTGILSATGFAGPLVGNVTGQATSALSAVSSTNVAVSSNDLEALTMYPTFVSGITGSLPISVHSNKLGFKPSIGELSATVFKGDLDGNAANATSAVTADNALKSVIIDDASFSAITYPVFVNAAAGNQPLRSNSVNLSYVPASGTLRANEFVGKFSGNLNGIATNALDATNSANVSITDDLASNKFMPLTFVDGFTGNLPVKVSSSKLRFNPSTGTLSAPTFTATSGFIGNASTATTISPTGLVLPVNGGTGQAAYTPGDMLYAESFNTLKKLPIGPIGSVLRVEQVGTSLVPSWATTGPGTVTEVKDGGTGLSSITTGGVLIGNGANNISTVSGSVGQVLRSNGLGLPPSFQNAAGGDMILAGVQEVTGSKTFGTPGVGGFGGINGVLRLAGVQSGETILNGPDIGNSGIVTLPQTGVLVTRDGIEKLTNKELTSPKLTTPDIGEAIGTTLKLGGGTPLTTTNQTGTGKLVMESGALLVAPNIGAATGTSLNVGPGGTITAGSFVGNLVNGSATLTDLTVNNPIFGNVNGNAATVTTNANLTGEVTSNGNAALLDNDAVISKLLTGYTSSIGTISATDNIVTAIGKLSGNIVAGSNATHTGDVTGSNLLTITNVAVTNAKIADKAVTYGKIQDVTVTNRVLGRVSAGSGVVEEIPTTGSGDVVRSNTPTLVTPIIGAATGTSLSVSGQLTSTIGTGIAPIVVNSTTPVANLSIEGNASTATLASKVTTNANLTGDVTSVGNVTTLTNAAVIAKVLTGYTAGAGTVVATDNVLEAIQKVDGNDALKAPLASPTFTGTPSLPTGTTGITQTALTSNTTLATTAYADAAAGAAVTGKQNTLTNSSGLAGSLNDETGTGLAVFATNPILTTPNLGTPSTLVGTNITGTAAGLTAGKVTTNANLTGDVTSVGNVTTVKNINGVALSGLTTGILKNTTTTGAPSIAIAGTDYLLPTGSAAGLTGFPIFNQSTTNNAGTATKLESPRFIYGSQFNGTADLGGIIGSIFGGTGNGFTKFVGPTSSEKSYTLPDANAILARTDAAQSFTGVQAFTSTIVGSISGNAATATTATTATSANTTTNLAAGSGGQIPYQSAAGTTAMLANGIAGQVLQSNGTTLAPSWVAAATGDMTLAGVQTVTGTKTFESANLVLQGSTSGSTILNAGGTASGIAILPAAGGTLATLAGTETFTNKTLTSPTLVTPIIGVATATSVNKVAITQPSSGSATLTLENGSTLATSGANSITLTSTGPTNVTLPTSGILVSAISVSGTLNFVSVGPGLSDTETITVTGAADGDAVSLGVPNALASAGGIYTAWVSAPDTVTVKFSNTTTGATIGPASATFKIKVLK